MASEKISVVLEADAKQLTGEFNRARQTADAFSQRTLPLVAAGLNQVEMTSKRAEKGMRQLQTSARGTGQGMLQVAQFADDMQYGLRGVMNNIPGLLMGLGAGAGLAGVLSLAALAGAQLLPVLKELYTDTDATRIAAVAKSVQDRFATEIKALQVAREEKQIREETAALLVGMAAYADREQRVQDQRLAIITSQRQEMELQRRLADQITAARNGVAIAGATTPEAAAALRAGQASAARDQTVERMREELDLARREAEVAHSEYERISAEASNVRTASMANLAAAQAEIARLERNIASGRANVAGFEEGVKQGLSGSAANLAAASKRLAAEEAALARQRELVAQITVEQERTTALAAEQLASLSARVDGAEREKRALEKQIPAMEELNRLARQREEAEARTADEARLNRELEARRASINAAREQGGDDLIMRGTGAKTNVTDAERSRAYRNTLAVRDRVFREFGLMPTARGISAGSGGFGSRLQGPRGLDGPRGLGPDTRRRFGSADDAAAMTAAMTAAQRTAAYEVKRLENDEKLIKAFQALGLL